MQQCFKRKRESTYQLKNKISSLGRLEIQKGEVFSFLLNLLKSLKAFS
jgi:hypothetical protein